MRSLLRLQVKKKRPMHKLLHRLPTRKRGYGARDMVEGRGKKRTHSIRTHTTHTHAHTHMHTHDTHTHTHTHSHTHSHTRDAHTRRQTQTCGHVHTRHQHRQTHIVHTHMVFVGEPPEKFAQLLMDPTLFVSSWLLAGGCSSIIFFVSSWLLAGGCSSIKISTLAICVLWSWVI